jgi:hypothetical protein
MLHSTFRTRAHGVLGVLLGAVTAVGAPDTARAQPAVVPPAVAGYPADYFSAITRQWNFRGCHIGTIVDDPDGWVRGQTFCMQGAIYLGQRATGSGWGSWMDLAFTDVDPRLRRGPVYRGSGNTNIVFTFLRGSTGGCEVGRRCTFSDQMDEGAPTAPTPERPWTAGDLNIHDLINTGWADPTTVELQSVRLGVNYIEGGSLGMYTDWTIGVPFTTVPEPHTYALLGAGLAGVAVGVGFGRRRRADA